ncbi:MAG: MazG family protein, partial [Acidimicrobiia bacterium]
AAQTHHSLARHLVEEAYEVIEAIEALPASAPGGRDPIPQGAYEALEDELGDLAIQVVLHATFAREAGACTVTDVLNAIHDKMVRRHPHVFGDVEADTADQVMANWEQIKRTEKGGASLMDEVPKNLPSLLYVHKLYRKASAAGLEFGTAGEARDRAVDSLRSLPDDLGADIEAGLGEALAALVYLARTAGLDAETALRGWAGRFRTRFQAFERLAAERGVVLEALPAPDRLELWRDTASAPLPKH